MSQHLIECTTKCVERHRAKPGPLPVLSAPVNSWSSVADLQSSVRPSGTHQQPAFMPAPCQARMHPVASACFEKSVQLTSSLSSRAMESGLYPTLEGLCDHGRSDCPHKHISMQGFIFRLELMVKGYQVSTDSSCLRRSWGLCSGFRGSICQSLMPPSILGSLVAVICHFFTLAYKLRAKF